MATLSPLALHFQTVDPLHLPFPDDWFDAALSLTGYGYLPARSSRLAALDEIYRVLRAGAPLVLSYYVDSDVAPEEREERLEGLDGLRDEEQPIQAVGQAVGQDVSPTTSEGVGERFVRRLTAQTFQEELSHSRFQVQRFIVEKVPRFSGDTMGAALLIVEPGKKRTMSGITN